LLSKTNADILPNLRYIVKNMNINNKLKNLLVRLALGLLKAISWLSSGLVNIFRDYLAKPLRWLGSLLYFFIILPIYKILISLNFVLNKIIGPVKNKHLLPFLNRFVSHALIFILTGLIVMMNLGIGVSRAESFGEQSILYALIKGEDLQDTYYEEDSSVVSPKTFSYLEEITPSVTPLTDGIDTDFGLEDATDEILTTSSGEIITKDVASLESIKKSRDRVINYVVKDGDTLSVIASNFGLKTTSLMWANNLNSGSYLRPGQNLDIPPVDGIIYTVKKGDTISKIAGRYQAEAEKVILYNKLAGASDIVVGQTLILPGAKPYLEPAPVQKAKIAPVKNLFAGAPSSAEISSSGLIWPTVTRRLSQYFSWRHTGLDINGEFGDPIWSSGEGTVIRVQYLTRDYGYNIIVDHGNGLHTLYAHFQKIYVKEGQTVRRGDPLGEMGSTGRSTGSHLHYEVRKNGKRLNPLAWVKQ
jgi:murein DD-endopeptidase MepM/ murein hydrolase activator NlpD